ncbi:MAG TPA: ATP-dependent zinc metalloprotease FtsH [Chloroflexota bacterium]|nr:ATP-dependent zinc metalloprotease FtsH [Chloroflexota bacterium]
MRFRNLQKNRRWIVLLAAVAILIVASTVLIFRSNSLSGKVDDQPRPVNVDQVARLAKDGEIKTLSLNGDVVTARLTDGSSVISRKEAQVSILDTLRSYGVPDSSLQQIGLEVRDPLAGNSQSGTWVLLLVSGVSVLLVLGVIYIGTKNGGAGGRYGSFTRSGARVSKGASQNTRTAPSVTFRQVAGVDEAKQELEEVVEFLKSPQKFTALGATIPKGALLVGPPGTGKTLLAKAVAGEAGVPFFSISGSEFVEMYVGVGASRVRDLFSRARRSAPCIVFIDEIDAVGRHRGSGMRHGHGGNDEREQTLNQILVEMDGFDGRSGVVVLAATNRPDVLDEALLRPGRFDRQVTIDSPDIRGRKAILAIHARGKPISNEVSLDTLARQTPGFSGADLANLLNEAAILAARRGRKSIARADAEEAIDRCIAGPQRKSRVISEKERQITAYHELGHALVATSLPNCDPVHKVTIIGRGRAGGFTQFLPTEDRSLWTRSQFIDTMASILGGHAAEELVFGEVTTGASNDIEKATELAQRMVCNYGMSERFGPISLMKSDSSRSSSEPRMLSDDLSRDIDREIHQLIDDARNRAKELLASRRETLESLTALLLERETLSGEEFRELAGTAK